MKVFKSLAVCLFAYSCVAVAADDTPAETVGYWSWGGGIDVITFGDQARQEGIKDTAFALGLNANYMKGDWITSLRTSFMQYSDNAEFSQMVDYNGDIESRSSDASGITLGVASGKFWRLGTEQKTVGSIQAGYDLVVASSRTIPSCTNCYEEDIDIDGGPFIKGTINQQLGSVYGALEVTQYLGGDGLTRRIGLTITSSF